MDMRLWSFVSSIYVDADSISKVGRGVEEVGIPPRVTDGPDWVEREAKI